MVSPRQRRAAVAWAQTAYQVSQRRACRALAVERTAVRYQPQRDPAPALRRRLHELATTRLTFGSRRLHTLLRRDGLEINYKRVHRLYVEEGLQLKPRRRRRRKAATVRETRSVPTAPNERWAMDVMHDVLKNGRAIRVFTLVDVCTRECVALHAAAGFKGSDVAEFLSAAGRQRGKLPEIVQCDNDLHPLSRVDSRRRDLRSRDGGAPAPSDDPLPHQHHVRTRVPSGLPRRTSPLLTIVGQHSIPTPV